MPASNKLSVSEMWEYMARNDGKSVEEVKAIYNPETPEDLESMRKQTIGFMEDDAMRETIGAVDLGDKLVDALTSILLDACSRGEDGRLVYHHDWSDEGVAQQLAGTIKSLGIARSVPEDLDMSPLMESGAGFAGGSLGTS
jgi:hypothetical protein